MFFNLGPLPYSKSFQKFIWVVVVVGGKLDCTGCSIMKVKKFELPTWARIQAVSWERCTFMLRRSNEAYRTGNVGLQKKSNMIYLTSCNVAHSEFSAWLMSATLRFLAWLSSATLKIFISGVSSRILMP